MNVAPGSEDTTVSLRAHSIESVDSVQDPAEVYVDLMMKNTSLSKMRRHEWRSNLIRSRRDSLLLDKHPE